LPVHPNNLKNKLQAQLNLRDRKLKKTNERRDWFSMPSPLIPAHEYEYSPVEISPILGVWGPEDFEGYSSHPEAVEPPVIIPEGRQLAILIDSSCNLEDIVNELKAYINPNLPRQRSQLIKYKDYLAVWDHRQEGLTDSQIAEKIWPKDWKRIGGRDSSIGVKGPLIQRVHDHERAAQKLIDESFPPKIQI